MSSERSVRDVSGPYIRCSGGEGGIRTPGRSFSPYNGLANRRLQPLGHLSAVCFQQLTTLAKAAYHASVPGEEINVSYRCGTLPNGQAKTVAVAGKILIVDGLIVHGNSGS